MVLKILYTLQTFNIPNMAYYGHIQKESPFPNYFRVKCFKLLPNMAQLGPFHEDGWFYF